ncbi:hypothetical protein [Herbaspirillum hiltneri]|uniref:hypothetical protein n=1 Tax=Herbaspirillum hiltneri TaxID=341045 RepID=UPI0011875C80|nr:hypothetical protein [Herbaspirillum hiltneri]
MMFLSKLFFFKHRLQPVGWRAAARILFGGPEQKYRTAAKSRVGQAANARVQGLRGLSYILEFLQIKRNVSYSQTPGGFFMLASTK